MVVLGTIVALVVTSPGLDGSRRRSCPGRVPGLVPGVLDGFWLDVQLFLIVEVIVLVLGLVVALVRTSPAPALFPLRALAVVYVDVFRGIPTILMVYLVGFGIPALEIDGVPTDPLVLGGIGLSLCYGAYVAEVYRAGIESVDDRQRPAALAVGLTPAQSLRFVVVPQAVRRIAPPLLNDFIALQKDVALVSILGPLEAFRVAQIEASSTFNYTPLLAAARCTWPSRSRSRGCSTSCARASAPAGPWSRRDRRPRSPRVTKAYGDREVLRGVDLAVEAHRAIALIGASGSGSRRCCAASTCWRRSTTATSCSTARSSPSRASTPSPSAAGSGWSSRASTCSATSTCSTT